MLRMKMRRAKIPYKALELTSRLNERLSSRGVPLLRSGLEAQRNVLSYKNLGSGPTQNDLLLRWEAGEIASEWGEIYVSGQEYYAVAFDLLARDSQRDATAPCFIHLYGITHARAPKLLDDFTALIEEVVGAKLEDHRYKSVEFNRIKKDSKHAFSVPTASEVELARLLADRDVRSLAVAIKQAGGLLESDIAKQLPEASTEYAKELRTKLEAAGIVSTEIVILCRQTSRQVFRIPSKDAISTVMNAGARCACGRSIDNERIEQAVSITDHGAALLDKSRWLSVLVYDELVQANLDPDRILIEAALGGDEVDCVADISGEVVLFELKDKEFNLREAYSFGAKIGIIKPEHAVVVTSSHIGGDALEHLKRTLTSQERGLDAFRHSAIRSSKPNNRVRYIAGVENLAPEILRLVSDIETGDATRVLTGILNTVRLNATELILAIVDQSDVHKSSMDADPASST